MDDVKGPVASAGEVEENEEIVDEADDLEESGFTPKVGKDGKPIPYNKDPRWSKVYKGFKVSREYEPLGTPQEVSAKLQELAYYKGLLAEVQEEGQAAAAGSKEEADAAKREEEIKKELVKLFPALKNLGQIEQNLDLYHNSLQTMAEDEVTKV